VHPSPYTQKNEPAVTVWPLGQAAKAEMDIGCDPKAILAPEGLGQGGQASAAITGAYFANRRSAEP
jgi:hypothetical protein